MSTSATVTLTLKSKPKLQAIQTAPRSSASGVKLKLTKVPPSSQSQNGNPTAVQTSSSSAETTPLVVERKSPSGNATPKLTRKFSLPKKLDTPSPKPEPAPPKKVFSRFSFKRNSVDKTSVKPSETEKKSESSSESSPCRPELRDSIKATPTIVNRTVTNGSADKSDLCVAGSLENKLALDQKSPQCIEKSNENKVVVSNGKSSDQENVNDKPDAKPVAENAVLSISAAVNRNSIETTDSKTQPNANEEQTQRAKTTLPRTPDAKVEQLTEAAKKKSPLKKTGTKLEAKTPEDATEASNGNSATQCAQTPTSAQQTAEVSMGSVEVVRKASVAESIEPVIEAVQKRVEITLNSCTDKGKPAAESKTVDESLVSAEDSEEASTASTLTPVSGEESPIKDSSRPTVSLTNHTVKVGQAEVTPTADQRKSLAVTRNSETTGKPPTASEKQYERPNAKTSTALGKTLQKPLNLAQKILEAALQKTSAPSSSSSSSNASNAVQAVPAASVSAYGSTCSLVEIAQAFAPSHSQPPSRPSSVMANIQTVDIRNLGRLLRSPTPRPLSVLDVERPHEADKDCAESSCLSSSMFPYPDTASSSGVSCSPSTTSMATTLAQSRSVSSESLISASVSASNNSSLRYASKKENFRRDSSEIHVDQQAVEALQRRQARLECDLREAHSSLGQERTQLASVQEELRQTRLERNDAQQRLDSVIAESVRNEKLAQKLQRELHQTTDHDKTADVEVGILRREQVRLEAMVSNQREDLQDLQSQLELLRGQNKQMQEEMLKQNQQFKTELDAKDKELDQIKSAAHSEVGHYQTLLKECQEQRRDLMRKNSELQDNRSELIQQVREVGDQAGNEKRLKRCLYRTLVLLRDARVTIEHMRATQPSRTHLSKLRQKVEEADQLKEIAERAKESAVAQSEQLEQAVEQLVQTRHFLQTRVEKLTSDNKQLQDQLGDLVVEHGELEDRYKKQVSVNCNEQENREEQANKIVKLEAQVETLESKIQQMRFERQVEDDCKVNSVLNSFETRTNQLELKLETEKLDKHKLQAQFNRLSDHMENLRRELDAAQKREASLQLTTTNQQRCLLDMRRELAETRDRNCQMRMERQTLDSQVEEFLEEVRHLQTCLRVANQRIRDLEIALETTDPIQIENIMESIIEDSASDDYEDADEKS